jgi:hypothetical protein
MRRETRAAVRLGAVIVAPALALGLVADYALTVLALELAAGAAAASSSGLGAHAALGVQTGRRSVRVAHVGVGLVLGVAYRAALEWNHTRRHIRPLHLALGELLGVPRAVRPRSWIALPRDYATRENAKITVKLPKGFALTSDVTREAVAEVIRAILGLEAASHKWHLAGDHPRAVFTVQTPPPDKVTLADIREAIRRGSDSVLTLGLGRGRREVACDFGFEPHVLISAASGAGKSIAIRTLVAQALHHGAIVLVLDIKRLSHAWCKGLPNVRYCRSIEEIHAALLWLGGEVLRRAEAADESADADGEVEPGSIGPRIIVLCEEVNATAQRLNAHWRKIRDKDDAKVSPAIECLADVSFMGRQVLCNLLCAGQMTTARALGSGEVRESFGYRLLSRWSLQAWRMLAGEIWPPPAGTRHKGRWQAVCAGQATEVQIAYLTSTEARELSTSGTVTEFPPLELPAEAAVHGGDGAAVIPLRAKPLISLREAVTSGIIPIPEGSTAARTLEAVRRARTRDGAEFPAPAEGGEPGRRALYDPDALAAWARNRPRAGVA